MKKLAKILGVIVLLAVTSAYAMSEVYGSGTWRYKITVEVETPEGIKTGSAIREVRAKTNLTKYINPDVKGMTYEVIGEAVVVDLGKGKILLELPSYEVFFTAFKIKDYKSDIERFESLPVSSVGEIDSSNHPFITFSNLDDPQTIKTVYAESFEKIFGENFKLNRVSLQKTDEEVTWGIVRKYLKWFDTKKMGLDYWDPSHPDQAQYFTKSSLIKGEK